MPAAESTGVAATPKQKPSVKAVGQVMAALKNIKSATGPTMTDIVKYVNSSLFKPATKIQICTALKRSTEFGILKRKKGHYFISTPEENFAQLPLSPIKKIGAKTRLGKAKFQSKVIKHDRSAKKKGRRPRVSNSKTTKRGFVNLPRLHLMPKPCEPRVYRKVPSDDVTEMVTADTIFEKQSSMDNMDMDFS